MRPAEPAPGAPDLLSSLCHDLREPLASIVMGAGFLRRSLKEEDDSSRRVAEAIYRAADRMGQLIASFSDLAGLQLNELVLEVRPQDIGALVRAAFERLRAEAASQDVQVSLDLASDMPDVPCDRTRVLQIVRHLGQAALRVAPEGGRIVVRAFQDDERSPRVSVMLERGATSRRLGTRPPTPALTIARGLVELHGGRLDVTGDEDRLTLSFDLPHHVRDGIEAARAHGQPSR